MDERIHAYLPAPSELARPLAPAPAPIPPSWEPEVEEAAVPLSHYLWIVKRHRWKIAATVLTCVAATVVVSSRLTPIYESTATIDIDRRIPTGILGQESLQSAATNDADQFMATQVKLIQSDSVLRPIARKHNLREMEKTGIPFLDKEKMNPAEREEAPVELKKLKVTRPPNTYLLLVSYRSPDRQLAADVANGTVQSYLEHTYNIRYRATAGLSQFMEKQLEELRAKMERSSAALVQFEKELNVISPEEKTNILSSRLIQLNTEHTNAQADRVRKEAAYNSIRAGTMEAAQVSTQGAALQRLTETLNDARQKFAEVKTHYGANHPEHRKAQSKVVETEKLLDGTRRSIGQRVEIEYREAQNREVMLQQAVAETKADFDRLNARSFEYQTLKREAETDKKLYEELVRKIKEAGINASFQNSSIRIADSARPGLKPVFPNLTLNVFLAFLFSTLLAVGGAILSDVLDTTIRDPEQVSKTLRAEVVGTLPMIKTWRGVRPTLAVNGAGANGNGKRLLESTTQVEQSTTGFDEAIRTLRNSILLTDFDRRLKTLLMTSASPAEGKSTVAAHLAISHAEQGHRTLLIDGDMRRPSVHKFFDISNLAGLSTTLVNDFPWREALTEPKPGIPLFVLPAGPASRRAADLVGRGLPQFLDEASQEFDLIILDAPPLLGFPEPLQMAACVDGVIIVTRAGQTNRTAVATVLSTLSRLRANVIGLVLNEVRKEMSHSYYYYGYYGKYYRDKQDAAS
ncbi:MAG: polysaccharide biosynthesis tyrosine autokinase [Gemmataceae bacterium]|nr:polysaccharide biosynthesis tyrosine autokinase [Gemmataceae bacterium]